MFDDSDGTRKYSELSKMLPHNFYGNIPSENVDILFKKWSEKYRQYTVFTTNYSSIFYKQ